MFFWVHDVLKAWVEVEGRKRCKKKSITFAEPQIHSYQEGEEDLASKILQKCMI